MASLISLNVFSEIRFGLMPAVRRRGKRVKMRRFNRTGRNCFRLLPPLAEKERVDDVLACRLCAHSYLNCEGVLKTQATSNVGEIFTGVLIRPTLTRTRNCARRRAFSTD